MGSDEVELGAGVIRRHEQVRLVLVGRVGRCWLRGRCQSLEVEFVGVALPVHLRHDVLIVVVPKRSGKYLSVNHQIDLRRQGNLNQFPCALPWIRLDFQGAVKALFATNDNRKAYEWRDCPAEPFK